MTPSYLELGYISLNMFSFQWLTASLLDVLSSFRGMNFFSWWVVNPERVCITRLHISRLVNHHGDCLTINRQWITIYCFVKSLSWLIYGCVAHLWNHMILFHCRFSHMTFTAIFFSLVNRLYPQIVYVYHTKFKFSQWLL